MYDANALYFSCKNIGFLVIVIEIRLVVKKRKEQNCFLPYLSDKTGIQNMKFYKKLVIIFLAMLIISCVLGSVLKTPIDSLVERNESIRELASYHDGEYNYGKILRRIFMIVIVSLLVLYRKSLGLRQLITDGLRFRPGWKNNLATGLSIGFISLSIYGIFTFILGVQRIENNPHSSSEFITKPIIYLFEACLIGLFEETLLRGVVLQGLMKDLSRSVSIISASLFYAFLHFFSFKVNISMGNHPFAGFTTLSGFFSLHNLDLQMILPYMIGLFLVGVVLSLAYLHTGSLYLSIGLHAGLVYGVKMNHMFLDHNHEISTWFFGDGHIVSGIFGWIFLVGILIIIKMGIPSTPVVRGLSINNVTN